MEKVQELELERERLRGEVVRLVKEKADAQQRLEFVEELLGPTEAQRKEFQDQLVAARAAALQAHRHRAPVPVRFVGRLDESWLRTRGLSERDSALLQRGCLTDQDGVSKDVSMLGDPSFRPYNEHTREPLWEARGGLLQLSLDDVRSRWGEEVAMEVVRCAMELDKHDASRRLGVELPWHEAEAREMEPAEVIAVLELELRATRCCSAGSSHNMFMTTGTEELPSEALPSEESSSSPTWSMLGGSEQPPPDDLCNDDWSLADGDIEQLLRPPLAPARRVPRKPADVPRSWLSSPREEYPQSPLFSAREEDEGIEEDSSQHSTRSFDNRCADADLEETRSVEDRDEFGEELGEVLRELLEEEVGGPSGRFYMQQPPQPPW